MNLTIKIKRHRNWPILLKISIPILSLLLIVLGTKFVIVPRIEAWLMEQEKLKVQSVVEVAHQQVVQGALAVSQRSISVEEAQKESSSAIREACLEQAGGSLRIKKMVHSISTSTWAVLEETKVVDRGARHRVKHGVAGKGDGRVQSLTHVNGR